MNNLESKFKEFESGLDTLSDTLDDALVVKMRLISELEDLRYELQNQVNMSK